MALTSGLTLYCYTLPPNSSAVVRAYVAEVDNLSFSSVAPGGFATLTARIALKDATIPQPQLGLGSRVAVMGRGWGSRQQTNGTPYGLFLGEIWDARLGLDARGSYVTISAVGAGNWLRDDPINKTYTNQTALQILTDQMTYRHAWNPQSADMGMVFPDNPGATYSPAYVRRTMEEVVQDVCTLAGDYVWGYWAHATQKDAAGFPLGQLFVHKRDTATQHYAAFVKTADVISYEIAPSGDRAYNDVKIDYSTANGVATAEYKDPRLNGDASQGSAPFRFRAITRDYTGVSTVGATQASAIASTFGAQMRNPSNKVTMSLRRVRDASGNLIPLWAVAADANISVPELAVRGQQLALAPTAGTNLFAIVRATYTESRSGQDLTLECDNYADRAATAIARLQNRADAIARAANFLQGAQMQAQGVPLTVPWSFNESNNVSGDPIGPTIQFPLRLYQAPTGITFTQSATPVGISSGPFSNAYSIYGCNAWCVSSGGRSSWIGTAVTVGNCIHAVHHEQGRLDWHCDGCDALHTGLLIAEHVMRSAPYGDEPGMTGMAIRCPGCGRVVESWNTGLRAHDAEASAPGNHERRAWQAELIRQLQQHPLVGLRAHPAV